MSDHLKRGSPENAASGHGNSLIKTKGAGTYFRHANMNQNYVSQACICQLEQKVHFKKNGKEIGNLLKLKL